VRKERKMRGFTLVELLIVLLVLGVLIGLAVPRYLASVEESKKTTFCSNVRSIMSALEMYRINEGEQYPATGSALTASIIKNPDYFSQPPKNPYTNEIMTPTDATDLNNAPKGNFTYQRVDDNSYTITSTPNCGLQ